MLTRPAVDVFINAYGLYDDTWAAYTEGIMNLTITLIFGYLYGLIGILLGKIISMFFMVVLWRPYNLYHNGFKQSICYYWKKIATHIIIISTCLICVHTAIFITNWEITPTIGGIFLFSFIFILPAIFLFSICIYIFCPGAKDLLMRIPIH